VSHHEVSGESPAEKVNIMQTDRSYGKRITQIKGIAILLAAAFLVTAVAISPALAKHDQDDEYERHGDDWHHEHKDHHKHWHEYAQHVYFPPPVVYGPPAGFYSPPPPVVYAPPLPTLSVVISLPIH
jgi:hypothetical protein